MEELEKKAVKMMTNPTTGEQVIIGEADEFDKSFEQIIDDINNDNSDIFDNRKPLSEKDVMDYISDDKSSTPLFKNKDPELDDIRKILEIANRKINKEKFNIYRELPESARKLVDNYVTQQLKSATNIVPINRINEIKKNISEDIMDQFISDINFNRAKSDFALELQKIYENANKELSDANLEFIDERNKEYRKLANEIEDIEKRNKLNSILDRIDEARALTELKEFAKSCKIKPIEIKKCNNRVYNGFLSKYRNSANNIYDINLAKTILTRHIIKDGYTPVDADMFLITFCKQVQEYDVNNPLEHAYMYYVLYYCAMLDGDKSDIFKNNVEEVIENSRARNKTLKEKL